MHIGGMPVQGGPQHIAHRRILSTKKRRRTCIASRQRGNNYKRRGLLWPLRAPASPAQSCFSLRGRSRRGPQRPPPTLVRRRALDHVLAALEVAVPHRAVEIDRGLLEALVEIEV